MDVLKKVAEISTYPLFQNIDPINIKIDEKSYKIILINCIGFVTPNNINLIFNNANGYIKKTNGYLTLVPTCESTDKLKKYKKIEKKLKILLNKLINNSDDYQEKYMTIIFS